MVLLLELFFRAVGHDLVYFFFLFAVRSTCQAHKLIDSISFVSCRQEPLHLHRQSIRLFADGLDRLHILNLGPTASWLSLLVFLHCSGGVPREGTHPVVEENAPRIHLKVLLVHVPVFVLGQSDGLGNDKG